jgi:hypothetical protein
MDIDYIINEAFINSIQGEGLFIVEGNPARNLLRILPADQAFKDNLSCFAWNINTGFQYMGIFTEEKDAQDCIDYITNNAFQDFIPAKGLFIVEGNPAKNLLRTVPADQAYKDNIKYFELKISSGFQYMAIFTEERLAQEHIERIRTRIRNEKGEKLF